MAYASLDSELRARALQLEAEFVDQPLTGQVSLQTRGLEAMSVVHVMTPSREKPRDTGASSLSP